MSDDDIDNLLNGKIWQLKTDDQLFAEAKDWWMNACLGWYRDPKQLYIVGYKEAGDSLVNSVTNRSSTADSLIFPIVFLYRRYIKLRLKSLLLDGSLLLGRACENTDANAVLGTDRGHQVPSAAFSNTAYWAMTNYLSNITPQPANLNQGPWVKLETAIRNLARTGQDV